MRRDHETILDVHGMRSRSCVPHISDALRGLGGVRGVEIDIPGGTVVVHHDPRATPVDRLVAALAEVGYVASLLEAA